MKVGVLLNYTASKEIGGGHSYYTRMTHKLINYKFDPELEIVIICFDKHQVFSNINQLKIHEIPKPLILYLSQLFLFILGATRLTKNYIYKKLYNYKDKAEAKIHEKKFKENGINILYYLTPSFNKYNYPYIATCWDLGFKSSYSFPEFSMNGSFEMRKNFAEKVYQKAFAIICESNAGKNDLIFYERINPQRIFVLPMIEGPVVDLLVEKSTQIEILKKHNLNESEYFYYPAQFWSHKNHINLLKAFKLIVNKNNKLKLVLTGSDKGNLDYVKEFILTHNIEHQVIICGFVELEEVYTFYKNSIALVYPSLLGPTNMPLIEAQRLGVKVVCSNLPGHIEQLGNKAAYFDPTDYIDIYNKLDSELCSTKKDVEVLFETPTCIILNDHLLKIKRFRSIFLNNFNQF
jgi:glycosyltransferase involved in cell wall biosynthesis